MTRPLTARRPRGQSLWGQRQYRRWASSRVFCQAREALYEAGTRRDVEALRIAIPRYQRARIRWAEAR